jgi:hypothetical protein
MRITEMIDDSLLGNIGKVCHLVYEIRMTDDSLAAELAMHVLHIGARSILEELETNPDLSVREETQLDNQLRELQCELTYDSYELNAGIIIRYLTNKEIATR